MSSTAQAWRSTPSSPPACMWSSSAAEPRRAQKPRAQPPA
jgi:hypothetical protein